MVDGRLVQETTISEFMTAELATALAEAGVTRISLGVQTLDNTELAAIGRIHNSLPFL